MQKVLLRFPQLKAEDALEVMAWLHESGIPYLVRNHYSMSMSTLAFISRRMMVNRIMAWDIMSPKTSLGDRYQQLDFLIRESDETLVRLKYLDLYSTLYYECLEKILSGNQNVQW